MKSFALLLTFLPVLLLQECGCSSRKEAKSPLEEEINDLQKDFVNAIDKLRSRLHQDHQVKYATMDKVNRVISNCSRECEGGEERESLNTLEDRISKKFQVLLKGLREEKSLRIELAESVSAMDKKYEQRLTVLTNKLNDLEKKYESKLEERINSIDQKHSRSLQRVMSEMDELKKRLEKHIAETNWKCYHWTSTDRFSIKLHGGGNEGERQVCEKTHGHVFTAGYNTLTPGCGTCDCCQRSA